MITPAVRQARQAIISQIKVNAARLTVYRYPLVESFGELKPDFTKAPATHELVARIAHERKAIPDSVAGSTGESTNLSRFIIADYKSDIKKYDRFRYEAKAWQVGDIDPLSYGGERTGYQAPLEEAADVPSP